LYGLSSKEHSEEEIKYLKEHITPPTTPGYPAYTGIPLYEEIITEPSSQLNPKESNKQYLITIRYHYPFIIFPENLQKEIKEITDFFRIYAYGSNTVVDAGKLISILNYRVTFDKEKIRFFVRTMVGILDRYGVEIFSSDFVRIK
jgi:hypothetical protein